ncbi:uncharacterized protein B4U79_12827 [Dinothrombium tinctorium]|uniref:Uncharacterized protein n=1 Tax=Dinothrombium tinctorium TaxID=1965070 RepID=A0A3S4QDU2_9ACAR|nr:uncharacterized protein B4U79_12827 [Dinothrombium tinctorium]
MATPKLSISLLFLMMIASNCVCGPVAVGICYAGCAALACACFSAAGFTFGTVPISIIAATPALATCNSAFATCMAACSAALVAPTP